jgi:ATP-dependent Clp protease adaptor protein ClpS
MRATTAELMADKYPAVFSSKPSVPSRQNEHDGELDLADRVETPKMYKVLLLNDDYTPMEFVVLVLRRFFGKTEDQAAAIMLDVHKKGSGVAGTFTLELAEMKSMQVNQYARMNQHPLKSTVEPE